MHDPAEIIKGLQKLTIPTYGMPANEIIGHRIRPEAQAAIDFIAAQMSTTASPRITFETELAALIERHGRKLTDNQIITPLEHALDEALVLAGEPEATKVRRELIEALEPFAKEGAAWSGYSQMVYATPDDFKRAAEAYAAHDQARQS